MIDKSFAQKIGLRGEQVEMSMQGLWSDVVQSTCERLSFVVKGARKEEKVEHAFAVPNLVLPGQTLPLDIVQRIREHEDIELHPYRNAKPLIILGQDNWELIRSFESRRIGDSGLAISYGLLGWIVHGYVQDRQIEGHSFNIQLTSCASEKSINTEITEYSKLDDLIHYYFNLENLGVEETKLKNRKYDESLKRLRETTRKIGKVWETGLLWKSEENPNVNSKAMAMKRLYSVERKLDRNSEFANLYYKEMDRLIENGYAVKITFSQDRPRIWYLPHFGVENINKSGKVRLVFDAAAKAEGTSLNDQLETGPDLLESLIGVLLRFRQYGFAVKADIKDMFLRVKVIERDRGAQRFLYRGSDRNREPDVYEMTSLVFGSKSSPCSAIYVKNRNAETFARTKPEAAKSLVKNTYMDDYLASRETVSEMKTLARDVALINREANFHMHGWASNASRTIELVNEENRLENNAKTSLGSEEDRILGLFWDRHLDNLGFNVGLKKIRGNLLNGEIKPTKREVFSIVMSVYDPLGILSTFTVQAKLLMQTIWRTGINWDKLIRDEEFKTWVIWLNNLRKVSDCKIPRCYIPRDDRYSNTQLHVFCDASLQAYASVAYLRTVTQDGRVHLSLVMAKTRVAPVKPMTVPRLELQAALLGTRLATTIGDELDIVINGRTFWSDSTTVLQWIRSDPCRKQMFVANRLGEISETTRVSEWRWVPTRLNPADDATRSSSEATNSQDRWFTGPEYLLKDPEYWPKQKTLKEPEMKEINELEARKEFIGTSRANIIEVPTCARLWGWDGLLIIARRLKSAANQWRKKPKVKPSLENNIEAAKFWYREIQSSCFANELHALKNGKEIPRGSKLRDVKPYIDADGLLRAKGRVSKFRNRDFENSPIILDATHFATKLLIGMFHRRYFHANNETVINELRQQFYIVGLRNRLRWLAKQCVICRLRRAQPQNPPMADLPESRVAYKQRAFSHCGIDYFGPMFVKIGRRREKRWGVLFTCMTSRAIHLELAHTLSASSAIMALQRLAGRQGFPVAVYSDNGTNFTKASKELRDAIVGIDKNKQHHFATVNRFKWYFNPPDAPHMGGAWERLIRSVKIAIAHALNDQAPSEEVLLTLLIEIEHSVNSRPITHVSTDPRDEEALTPNHILIGVSSGSLRLERYEAEILSPRKQYEIVLNFANGFWKRWLREYLPTLLPRKKWHEAHPSLQVGDIVMIIDYQATRNSWKRGRITEICPEKDGIVRVAKVRAGKSELTRPVHRLIKIFGFQDREN